MTQLIVAFRSFENWPKKVTLKKTLRNDDITTCDDDDDDDDDDDGNYFVTTLSPEPHK